MHEISLARAIWRQVEAEMARHAGRLLALDLVVGAFSGADPESLEFALSLLARESDRPEAQVRIRTEPLAMTCQACGREFTPEHFALVCPACGSTDAEPVRGTDVRLESLEVETEDAETHSPR
ncbi:MAG: hydrogenase maturation nickel metallochaperone HypA [Phycisphaerae bacterium]